MSIKLEEHDIYPFDRQWIRIDADTDRSGPISRHTFVFMMVTFELQLQIRSTKHK